MNTERTNYEVYRDELLSNPEIKAKYDIEREKIKVDMMFETLREQVIKESSRKTILSQITKIYHEVSRVAF